MGIEEMYEARKINFNDVIETAKQESKKKVWHFGGWKVNSRGDMDYLNGSYFIEACDLDHDDWIIHLQEKGWINWNEFIPAYLQACRNRGVQTIKMLMYYE